MPERVEASVDIEAPVEQVYDYWETLQNLPKFMVNIEEIRETGPDMTHWKVKGPLGAKIEFDVRTTQQEQNEALGWNSIDGDVQTSGQVRFRELSEGNTRVETTINYWDPPAGRLGEVASRLVANPKVLLEQDLQNFKEIMEGTATPEEIQERTSAASAQSGIVATLTSGTGLLVLGGGLLLYFLLRGGGNSGSGRSSRRKGKKSRIIVEF